MRNNKKENGAEKLFRAMADREYAELVDIPEDKLRNELEYVSFEDEIDETKDVEIKGR